MSESRGERWRRVSMPQIARGRWMPIGWKAAIWAAWGKGVERTGG